MNLINQLKEEQSHRYIYELCLCIAEIDTESVVLIYGLAHYKAEAITFNLQTSLLCKICYLFY